MDINCFLFLGGGGVHCYMNIWLWWTWKHFSCYLKVKSVLQLKAIKTKSILSLLKQQENRVWWESDGEQYVRYAEIHQEALSCYLAT